MVGRARGIEEAFGGLVGVGMPACSECGEDPAELREGDSEVRPGRHRDALGPRRGSFGRFLVASDPGDERSDGVGCCDPLRLAEFCRQPPGLFCGGNRHAPVGDLRRHSSLQREHARQMPEPSLGSQAFDRLAQERRRDIEGPRRHRRRPQETGGVRVAVNTCRGFTQTLEYGRRLSEWVGVGLDGQDPEVC